MVRASAIQLRFCVAFGSEAMFGTRMVQLWVNTSPWVVYSGNSSGIWNWDTSGASLVRMRSGTKCQGWEIWWPPWPSCTVGFCLFSLAARALACWHSALACQHSRAQHSLQCFFPGKHGTSFLLMLSIPLMHFSNPNKSIHYSFKPGGVKNRVGPQTHAFTWPWKKHPASSIFICSPKLGTFTDAFLSSGKCIHMSK